MEEDAELIRAFSRKHGTTFEKGGTVINAHLSAEREVRNLSRMGSHTYCRVGEGWRICSRMKPSACRAGGFCFWWAVSQDNKVDDGLADLYTARVGEGGMPNVENTGRLYMIRHDRQLDKVGKRGQWEWK